MQRIEQIFGFRVELDDHLDEFRIDVLKEKAALIVARQDFDPKQYHLYFHQLSITLKRRHFAASRNIKDRVDELRLRFARNPKQNRDRKIRFFNYLIDDSRPKDVPSSSTESAVTYHLSGEYLATQLQFRNELVTFISKDLRNADRKIKISLHAFPTPSFRRQLRTKRQEAVTKLDLRYDRYASIGITDGSAVLTSATDQQYGVQGDENATARAVNPAGNTLGYSMQMDNVDRNRLRNILSDLASKSDAPKAWFRDIVNDSDIPQTFKEVVQDIWRGDTRSDAGRLVDWAYGLSIDPQNPSFTTLGAILKAVLDSPVGLDKAQSVVAYIVKYGMYRERTALERLCQRYGVPAMAPRDGHDAVGPWLGPELGADEELQAFFQRELDFLDVGFLERGMKCAGSVCRIEIPLGSPMGTGFLVAEDKVLTNFHVIKSRDSDVLEDNISNTFLRFRNVTAPNGQEAEGQIFRVVGPNPVLASSPSNKFDFALLSVDPTIRNRADLGKANLEPAALSNGMPLNILQHPHGGPMSFAFSKDGVRGVWAELGLVQYVTKAAGGSSGSPCFNDEWSVVALHHAERARSFGSIREGILMSKLVPLIRPFL